MDLAHDVASALLVGVAVRKVSVELTSARCAPLVFLAQTLARMKPGAILINTARGSVVDEEALATALSQRQIAAAGLDVYEQEPAVSPALRELENVILLPHLGSATLEARTAMGMQMADNLDSFFAGRTPPNRVA